MGDESRATAVLYEEGEEQEVDGESHYQDALVRIAGPKVATGHSLTVIAALVPDPYDRMAVEVRVDGRKVGYLPANIAIKYQPVLLQLLKEKNLYVACHATIKGGWRRAGQDNGSFGISLTSFPPVSEILGPWTGLPSSTRLVRS